MGKGKTAKPTTPHGATVTLVGEVVQRGKVIAQVPTEWPKVGCLVVVRHNADQHTVFPVVAIGPVAETMLKTKRGATVKVVGHLKASQGKVEVFATEFGPSRAAEVTVRLNGYNLGGGFYIGGMGGDHINDHTDEDDEEDEGDDA